MENIGSRVSFIDNPEYFLEAKRIEWMAKYDVNNKEIPNCAGNCYVLLVKDDEIVGQFNADIYDIMSENYIIADNPKQK